MNHRIMTAKDLKNVVEKKIDTLGRSKCRNQSIADIAAQHLNSISYLTINSATFYIICQKT